MAVGQTQYPGAADTAQTLVEPSDWPVVTELRRRIDASETTLPAPLSCACGTSSTSISRHRHLGSSIPTTSHGCRRPAGTSHTDEPT